MADYSKQYIDKYDQGGMKPDFDIIEEAKLLKPDTYIPIICEGFGFIAIGKSSDGRTMLAMPQPYKEGEEEAFMWKDYEEIINEEITNLN